MHEDDMSDQDDGGSTFSPHEELRLLKDEMEKLRRRIDHLNEKSNPVAQVFPARHETDRYVMFVLRQTGTKENIPLAALTSKGVLVPVKLSPSEQMVAVKAGVSVTKGRITVSHEEDV